MIGVVRDRKNMAAFFSPINSATPGHIWYCGSIEVNAAVPDTTYGRVWCCLWKKAAMFFPNPRQVLSYIGGGISHWGRGVCELSDGRGPSGPPIRFQFLGCCIDFDERAFTVLCIIVSRRTGHTSGIWNMAAMSRLSMYMSHGRGDEAPFS